MENHYLKIHSLFPSPPSPHHPPSIQQLCRSVYGSWYSLTNYTISPHGSRENLNPMKDNKNYCTIFMAQSEHLLMHMACQALFYSMLRHEKKACMIVDNNTPITSSPESQRIRLDHLSVLPPNFFRISCTTPANWCIAFSVFRHFPHFINLKADYPVLNPWYGRHNDHTVHTLSSRFPLV